MDAVIMVLVMTLLLSGSTRATTLIVSNQLQTRGNVPVFVTCHGTAPTFSKSIPLGQVSLIEIPPIAGNNVTDGKTAGSKELQRTTCLGTFYREYHFSQFQRSSVLYSSDTDSTVCKNVCFIVVKDDGYGFYRWNNDKSVWDTIYPIIWY